MATAESPAMSCGTGLWNGPKPGDPDNSSILSATSEFGGIQVSWSMPNLNSYAVAYTRLFRSAGNSFATAIPFKDVGGNSYFDQSSTDIIQTYYYWIQHVTVNGTVMEVIGPASAVPKPMLDQIIEGMAQRIEAGHLSSALRTRVDKIEDLQLGLTNLNTVFTQENQIITQELLGVRNDLTDSLAYISQQREIEATDRAAFVQQVNTQIASIEAGDSSGLYAAVREEVTTLATKTGELQAQKLIQLDVAGNVSGLGLVASVDPQGNADSEFQVRSDLISFAPPTVNSSTTPTNPFHGKIWLDTSVSPNVVRWYNKPAGAWQTTPVKGAVPFVVRTVPETIDGYTIDPGVWISGAFIDRLNANQIDTRGLIIRDLDGSPAIQMGASIDWAKFGGGESNLVGLGYSGDLDATRGAPLGTSIGGRQVEDVLFELALVGQLADDANYGLNDRLKKAGDAFTGSIAFATDGLIYAGTDPDNGVFFGPTGLLGKSDGDIKFSIPITGDPTFAGNLMAPSGTLGYITAGFLTNPLGSTVINLGAVGSQPCIRAGDFDSSLGRYKVDIRPNGDAFFGKRIAGNTWMGNVSVFNNFYDFDSSSWGNSPNGVTFEIDTQLRVPNSIVTRRDISARLGMFQGEVPGHPNNPGQYVCNYDITLTPFYKTPVYISPAPNNLDNREVWLRVHVKISNFSEFGEYHYKLTKLAWEIFYGA